MAQVSANPLKDDVWKIVWDNFSKVVSEVQSKETAGILLSGLLTSTEQIMLSKRFMVAVLTTWGWTIRQIATTLHVSTSTIISLRHELELNKEYQAYIKEKYPEKIIFEKEVSTSEMIAALMKQLFSMRKNAYKKAKGYGPS